MLNTFDLLSPPITLFYLGKRTHTSKIGGSFILLLFCLCSTYLIYLFYLLAQHKQITSIFYKKFNPDIDKYHFNSSSLYFFIQFHSIDNESYKYKYASKYVRTYTYYGNTDFEESSLDKVDHWAYDTCKEGIDNKNLDSNLFQSINNFEEAACLKYYYNSKEKKYFGVEEKGFIWPYLAHGTAQKNNVFLHTSIQKCTNDSTMNELFGDCPPKEEIDEYTTKIVAIFLYLLDNQVDPTNYRNPLQKYMQSVSSGMGSAQSFEESYIFYSPLKVRTKENSIFGEDKDLESLFFDSSLKSSAPNDEKYFKYTRFTHFVQNNVQIYERRYDDFFEVISHIGGIMQCLFNVLYWLNYFYNRYIIIDDTNRLFFSIIERRADSLNGEKIKQLNSNKNQNNKTHLTDSSVQELKIKPKANTLIENIINKCNYGYNILKEKNNSVSKVIEGGKSIKNNYKTNLLHINDSKYNKW